MTVSDTFEASVNFLMAETPTALGAVVDFGEFSVHLFKVKKCSKKTKSHVTKR